MTPAEIPVELSAATADLEAFRPDMEGCSRCSCCKWVPLNQVRSQRFSQVCPSISYHDFHAYSGSGKLNVSLSILDGRTDLDEAAAEIFYSCTMCGACEVSCKVYRNDIDLMSVLNEARARAVETGHARLAHLVMVEQMEAENNVFGEPQADRADWEEATRHLPLVDANTEQVDVLFHVGCRYAYDRSQWGDLRDALEVLVATGMRIGTSRAAESCCGFRAYETGFKNELTKFADDMANRVRTSGAKMVAVACADCFGAFNHLYTKAGTPLGVPVRHVVEIAAGLVADGRLRPVARPSQPVLSQPVRRITYHDPCNLGRRGQEFNGWWDPGTDGNKLDRPDDVRRRGDGGRYDEPRAVLDALPGIELVEMERIREFSWCCGAGGGCLEAAPELSEASARERLEEAFATGADALATSCPWCVHNFRSALDGMHAEGDTRSIEIVTLPALVAESIAGGKTEIMGETLPEVTL